MTRAKEAVVDEASWFHLDRAPGETLRAALGRTLRDAIGEGSLRPGARLPSSRRLAEHLGVSRGVTSDVYAQLSAQGYIVVGDRSAPVVADVALGGEEATAELAPEPKPPEIDLSTWSPDTTLFPARDWLNAVTRTLRSLPARSLDYGDPRGEAELRTTLSDHLGRTRGVIADPGLIVIVQGARQGTDILIRVLARRGVRRIATEDPSQTVPRDQMEIFGIEPVGCPVDKRWRQRSCRPRGGGADRHSGTPVPDRRRDERRAPPRGARVGAERRCDRDRGRLRRRVPLRPRAGAGDAGPRPRARRLRRHDRKDVRARVSARLGRRAGLDGRRGRVDEAAARLVLATRRSARARADDRERRLGPPHPPGPEHLPRAPRPADRIARPPPSRPRGERGHRRAARGAPLPAGGRRRGGGTVGP